MGFKEVGFCITYWVPSVLGLKPKVNPLNGRFLNQPDPIRFLPRMWTDVYRAMIGGDFPRIRDGGTSPTAPNFGKQPLKSPLFLTLLLMLSFTRPLSLPSRLHLPPAQASFAETVSQALRKSCSQSYDLVAVGPLNQTVFDHVCKQSGFHWIYISLMKYKLWGQPCPQLMCFSWCRFDLVTYVFVTYW